MASIEYLIRTKDDNGNVIDEKEGAVDITPEIVGEFGTKLIGYIDLDLVVDFVGGRPKNRPSPSA